MPGRSGGRVGWGLASAWRTELLAVRKRVPGLLTREGLLDEGKADALHDEAPALADCYTGAVTQRVALGPQRGRRVMKIGDPLEAYLASAPGRVTPVRAATESWFVFTRRPERGRFSELERDFLGNALCGLLWFQRRLLLWHGLLPGQSLLTATERRVLAHALDGATDKEVASRLDAGLHTTRAHMATLYRKFGVSSRAELLALWLGGNP